MDNPGVIGGAGGSEQVELNAQLLPGVQEFLVVFGGYLLWCRSLLLSADSYGGAVLIAARDHEDFVALGAMVAGKDIGWQVSSSDVAQMQCAVGVRPGYTDENTLHEGLTLVDILSQSLFGALQRQPRLVKLFPRQACGG